MLAAASLLEMRKKMWGKKTTKLTLDLGRGEET